MAVHAALPLVYGQVPLQWCWAHKVRNALNHMRKADQQAVKLALQQISHALNLREAKQAARLSKGSGLSDPITFGLVDISETVFEARSGGPPDDQCHRAPIQRGQKTHAAYGNIQ